MGGQPLHFRRIVGELSDGVIAERGHLSVPRKARK